MDDECLGSLVYGFHVLPSHLSHCGPTLLWQQIIELLLPVHEALNIGYLIRCLLFAAWPSFDFDEASPLSSSGEYSGAVSPRSLDIGTRTPLSADWFLLKLLFEVLIGA